MDTGSPEVAEPTTGGPASHPWRGPGLATALVLLALGLLYWPSVHYLLGLWSDLSVRAYGHGFLVLAISGYLIWSDRRALAALQPRPDYRGLIPVAGLGLLWMLAAVVDVQSVQLVVMVPLLLATVWTTLGPAVARRLLFPIGYLLFAIPVWEPILGPLQDFTTAVVFAAIRGVGVPALLSGHDIILPAGQFTIEAACSGLRYLLAALTLGTLYAYINYTRLSTRLLVVAISAAAAILANLARVFIVVYLGYLTDMQHPWVHDHLNLGWMLFGGLVLVLLVIDVAIHRRRSGGPSAPSAPPPHSRPTIPSASPPPSAPSPTSAGRWPTATVSILLALAVGPALAYAVKSRPAPPSVQLSAPAAVAPWSGPFPAGDGWRPHFPGAAANVNRRYTRDGAAVRLYIGYYPHQEQGRELVNDTNSLGDGRLWEVDRRTQPPHTLTTVPAIESVLISPDGRRRLAWHWYRVAGRDLTEPYRAKLWQLWGLLSGRPEAALVAIATDYPAQGLQAARTRLEAFVQAMGPAIPAALGEPRD